MACSRRHWGWATVLVLLGTLSAREAAAFNVGVVVPRNRSAEEHRYRLLLQEHNRRVTAVEEVFVSTNAERFAWIRAFPATPVRMRATGAEFFDKLEQATRVRPPHREDVQAQMFGPSFVTLLMGNRPQPAPATQPTPKVRKRYRVADDSVVLSGPVITSTITMRQYLPAQFQEFLDRNQLVLHSQQEFLLMGFFREGWVVVATMLTNPRPESREFQAIGPTLYEMKGSGSFFPTQMYNPSVLEPIDLYTLSTQPLLPKALDARFDLRPWEKREYQTPGTFLAGYSHAADTGLLVELDRIAELRSPARAHLVQGRFLFQKEVTNLAVAPHTVQMIPGDSQRGSPVDILLCILLGITPLLYTPESWFLIWLGGRDPKGGARNKPQRSPLVYLWPLYALVVAGFWISQMEDVGRAAALVPVAIGFLRLVAPRGPRRSGFTYRAQLPKRPAPKSPTGD